MKQQWHDNSGQAKSSDCGWRCSPAPESSQIAGVLLGASANICAHAALEPCTCLEHFGGVHQWQHSAASEALQKTGGLQEHARRAPSRRTRATRFETTARRDKIK